MLAAWPGVVSVVVALAATTLLPPAGAEAATTSPTCTLAGDLVQGSTRGSNLTPEGLGGSAGATPEACQAACCGHALCVAFTHSSFQETASANCAHGQPCCWLKASYAPIPGSANETAGHISRPPNVASPASVPIRVLTDVTIMLAGGSPVPNLTAGERAVCTLVAAAGGWTREPETFANGLVLNTSAVRCKVNATAELGGLASLRAVSAGGGSLSAELQLHPLLSVSLGRQPYTDESQGSLLVRLSDGAFGNIAVLTPVATVLVAGNHYKLELSGPKLQRGQTTVLSFPLTHLPPTILGDANATVSLALAGVAAATPLPFVRLGQAQASQSVVDYATGAVLTGPERVPLLPNGFDSHFSSASGAAFDESLAFDLARRGFNTVIFGACLDGIFSAQCTVNTLAVLDALGRYGVFGIVGTQWDGDDSDGAQTADNAAVRVRHANDDGGPPLAGLSAYVNNIKNHPALLGYYLFDDCCRESDAATSALYRSIKRLDPYHILYSPITGSTKGRAWFYQSATGPTRGGSPAFDVYTFEHYELPGVGGGLTTAQMLQAYPLDFAPCWAMGEASGQRDGNFPAESAAELSVQDWIAFLGGGVRGQLWFDLSYSVNAQIVEAASAVGIKLGTLIDGILSPVDVSQPKAASSVAGVHAKAFWTSNQVENGRGRGDFYVAVVNERLAPVRNVSVSVVLPNGELALGTATYNRITVPFEESRVVDTSSGGVAATHLITEPLGSYEARVYQVQASGASDTNPSPLAAAAELPSPSDTNLVTNADFAAQTLAGTPDRWLLFPTQGTPAGGMDLNAVVMVDYAAARRGSNTTAALRVVLSNPLGTGVHLPLSVDHTGLSSNEEYNLSFWAKTNAVVGTGVLVLSRSPRSWHYGDSSPSLLEDVEAFVLSTTWKRYSTLLRGVNGTLNLLPREAGALWLSEPSLRVAEEASDGRQTRF